MHRRSIVASVLAALLVSMSATRAVPFVAATDDADGTVPLTVPDVAFDEAVRVRTELGLDTDDGVVRDLLADSKADRQLGTPLAPREVELMQARAAIQRGLQPVRDRLTDSMDDFASLWLSYPRGGTVDKALTVNVNVVAGHEAAAADLITMVPTNAKLELHTVSFSAQELHNVRMALREDEGWFKSALGTRLLMSELDVVRNQMVVYLSETSPGIAGAIERRFGLGTIRVETFTGEGGLDACTRTNCGPPWVGGVKIVRVGVGNACTLGFVVRQGTTSNYGVWTAGHCGSGSWKQGSLTGTTIGTTLAGSNRSVDGSTADIQILPIPATQKTNRYINDTATCNPCNVTSLTGTQVQQPYNGDEVGDSVCNNGYVTGRSCGVIQSTNVDNFEYPGGVHLFNQRRATYTRAMGDSGGPVYAAIGLDAAGSHVHFVQISGINRPIYSHVWEMSLSGYRVWNGV